MAAAFSFPANRSGPHAAGATWPSGERADPALEGVESEHVELEPFGERLESGLVEFESFGERLVSEDLVAKSSSSSSSSIAIRTRAAASRRAAASTTRWRPASAEKAAGSLVMRRERGLPGSDEAELRTLEEELRLPRLDERSSAVSFAKASLRWKAALQFA